MGFKQRRIVNAHVPVQWLFNQWLFNRAAFAQPTRLSQFIGSDLKFIGLPKQTADTDRL